MKVRQNLYLDHAITDALEALAGGAGGNKSRLVNDALRDWLSRRGTKEIDDLFKDRLARMTREIAGARRDIDILLAALSLFIRHQLTVTPPLPEEDKAAIASGHARYAQFIVQVGREIAAPQQSLASQHAAGSAG